MDLNAIVRRSYVQYLETWYRSWVFLVYLLLFTVTQLYALRVTLEAWEKLPPGNTAFLWTLTVICFYPVALLFAVFKFRRRFREVPEEKVREKLLDFYFSLVVVSLILSGMFFSAVNRCL